MKIECDRYFEGGKFVVTLTLVAEEPLEEEFILPQIDSEYLCLIDAAYQGKKRIPGKELKELLGRDIRASLLENSKVLRIERENYTDKIDDIIRDMMAHILFNGIRRRKKPEG